MNTIRTLFLLCIFAVSVMGQATPATPLLLDISAGATRSFNLPSGKVLTFKSGSQLAIDDGTTFNIGATAAASLRSAIGDFSSTRVFTNDANRLAATPNFTGQLGLQTDTSTLYISDSTTTGDWVNQFNFGGVSTTGGIYAAQGIYGVADGTYAGVRGFSSTAGLSGGWMESTNTGTALNLNSTSSGLLLEGRNSGSVNVSLSKTGVFLAGDGAVGGPSLGFINDPDTGFYSSGANAIGIAAGGASVGTFSGSGLALAGPLSAGGGLTGTTATFSGAVAGTTGTFSTSVISPNLAPSGNLTLTQNSVVPFTSVGSGATVNTLVLSAGNVGVGTAAPSALLEIVKNNGSYSGPRFRVTNSNAASRNAFLQFCYGATPSVGWQFGADPGGIGGSDFVIASGDAGTYSPRLALATTTTTINGGIIYEVQSLSGAGAVDVVTTITKLTTTGGSQALTLANGTNGQRKTIIHAVDGGSAILTPTTKTGFSTITFTNVGESATLVYFTTQGWMIESAYLATVAP